MANAISVCRDAEGSNTEVELKGSRIYLRMTKYPTNKADISKHQSNYSAILKSNSNHLS